MEELVSSRHRQAVHAGGSIAHKVIVDLDVTRKALAYAIFNKPARELTGRFLIDEDVLAGEGKTALSEYAVDPTAQLMPDFFV